MPLETFAAAQPPAPPAPAPVEVTTGSLIGRCFSTWWHNMLKFAAFTLVLFVPILLVMAAVLGVSFFTALVSNSQAAAAEMAGRAVLIVALIVPLVAIAGVVQMGGLTYGAVQHLGDRPVRIGGMFSVGFRRLLPLIGLALLLFVAMVVATFAIALVGGLLGKIVSVLLFIAFFVAVIVVMCGLAASVPAIVAEWVGPIGGIQRSWSLTSGHRGAIFLTFLVLIIAQFVIALVAGYLGRIPVLGLIISLAVQFLAGSLTTVMPAVAYNDLRMLKEGASTDELAKVFE